MPFPPNLASTFAPATSAAHVTDMSIIGNSTTGVKARSEWCSSSKRLRVLSLSFVLSLSLSVSRASSVVRGAAVADARAAASAALAEHLIGAKREVSQVSDQSPVAKRVLEQIWPKLDPEAQGVVPTKELFQLLVKVCAPLPEDKVKRLVEDADADHDGRVSREELLTLLVVLSDAKTGWSTRRVSAAQSDRPSRHIRLSRGRDNWSIEH